jgi:hypothetical protein
MYIIKAILNQLKTKLKKKYSVKIWIFHRLQKTR